MARRITDIPQTNAPTTDYPQGRVRDESVAGSNDGSLVAETMVGDILVFFNKLMADAGVTPNGNPDNTTNGFQLMEAFLNRIGQIAIPDDSITTPKIVDVNVTEPKMATGSVISRVLGALSVITSKIANSAVTFVKMQNITTGRLLGRVTGGTGNIEQLTAAQVATFLNNSIGNGQLTSNSVTASKIVNQTITAIKLANGSVIANAIANGAITTVKIGNEQVTKEKVSNTVCASGELSGQDFNTYTKSGIYFIDGENSANNPSPFFQQKLEVIFNNSNSIYQISMNLGTLGGSGVIQRRFFNGTTWSSWVIINS